MKKLFTAIARLKYHCEWLTDTNQNPKKIKVAQDNYNDVLNGVNELLEQIKYLKIKLSEAELNYIYQEHLQETNYIQYEAQFYYKYALLRGVNMAEINSLPLYRTNGRIDFLRSGIILDSILDNNEPQTLSYSDMYQVINSYAAMMLLKNLNLSQLKQLETLENNKNLTDFVEEQKTKYLKELNYLYGLLAPAKINIYYKLF